LKYKSAHHCSKDWNFLVIPVEVCLGGNQIRLNAEQVIRNYNLVQ
jgi:hypothetical protein